MASDLTGFFGSLTFRAAIQSGWIAASGSQELAQQDRVMVVAYRPVPGTSLVAVAYRYLFAGTSFGWRKAAIEQLHRDHIV